VEPSTVPKSANSAIRPIRRGFTLVEVLLVMSLLVLLTALVLPALGGPLERARMRRAADQVRAAWTKARVEAMRSGGVQVFTYAPGGREYRIEPRSASPATFDPAGGAALAVDPQVAAAVVEAKLPEGVVFASDDDWLRAMSGEAADPVDDELLDPLGGLAGGAASSPPIFFFPDGTSSTASLVLRGRRGYCVDVSLRGLTGVAAMGEIRRSGQPGEPLP
jgi:prepilin-type N-terminal cleavage/methylation domain-containing protein